MSNQRGCWLNYIIILIFYLRNELVGSWSMATSFWNIIQSRWIYMHSEQLRPKSSKAKKNGRGGLLEIQILPKTKIRPAFAGFWAKGQAHNRLLRPLQSCQVDNNLWQLCTWTSRHDPSDPAALLEVSIVSLLMVRMLARVNYFARWEKVIGGTFVWKKLDTPQRGQGQAAAGDGGRARLDLDQRGQHSSHHDHDLINLISVVSTLAIFVMIIIILVIVVSILQSPTSSWSLSFWSDQRSQHQHQIVMINISLLSVVKVKAYQYIIIILLPPLSWLLSRWTSTPTPSTTWPPTSNVRQRVLLSTR